MLQYSILQITASPPVCVLLEPHNDDAGSVPNSRKEQRSFLVLLETSPTACLRKDADRAYSPLLHRCSPQELCEGHDEIRSCWTGGSGRFSKCLLCLARYTVMSLFAAIIPQLVQPCSPMALRCNARIPSLVCGTGQTEWDADVSAGLEVIARQADDMGARISMVFPSTRS